MSKARKYETKAEQYLDLMQRAGKAGDEKGKAAAARGADAAFRAAHKARKDEKR